MGGNYAKCGAVSHTRSRVTASGIHNERGGYIEQSVK